MNSNPSSLSFHSQSIFFLDEDSMPKIDVYRAKRGRKLMSLPLEKNSFSLFKGVWWVRRIETYFFFFFLSKVRLENFVQLGTISLNFISEGGEGRIGTKLRVFSRFLNIWKHRIAGPTNTLSSSFSSSCNPFISTTSWFYKCERFQVNAKAFRLRINAGVFRFTPIVLIIDTVKHSPFQQFFTSNNIII